MWRSLTICFAFASLCVLTACHSAYRTLRPVTDGPERTLTARPHPSLTYYRVDVDLTGHTLNGILVVKRMEDSSLRMVYTNRMGVTYFDLGYRSGDGFTVHRILDQLNKQAVVRTLEKDMKLVWMLDVPQTGLRQFTRDKVFYQLWQEGEDHYYYLTNAAGDSLLRAERASSRKTIAVAETFGFTDGMPDSVSLTHHNLAMTIRMKQFSHDTP